jgi:hypothetical protein
MLLLAISIVRTTAITPKRAAAIALALGMSCYVGIWAIYGFRYAPGPVPRSFSEGGPVDGWVFRFQDTATVQQHGGFIVTSMLWLDSHRLLPNAFAQGFALTLASAAGLPGFLAGQYGTGWWYYFPVALLIKTPISMLLLAVAGSWALLRRRDIISAAFLLLPALVILGAAMTSPINIGIRHVLGVFPFMILVGSAIVRRLFDAGVAGRAAVAGACLAAVVEFTTVYPHTLTFFNALVGGPRNGSRYLADSNVDWGQDLKLLKRWMDASGIEHVNIAYFGTADPAYYGIKCTRLPGAGLFDQDKVARPELPGYVAISETVLSGVYLPPRWRLHYRPLAGVRPVARIGNSMRVYWLERWPDIPQSALDTLADFDSLRRLADNLMRHRWYTRAAASYTRYLARRPNNAEALGNLGVALVALGRKDEALDAFRRAAAVAPTDPRAQLNLTLALLDAGLTSDALASAKRFVASSPSDPAAQHLLGRALAAQRQQVAAAEAPPGPPRSPETEASI